MAARDDAIAQHQAAEVKERLQRAQHVQRSLQENLRIRGGLESQLCDLQEQLQEKRDACDALQQKRRELSSSLQILQSRIQDLQREDSSIRTARANKLEETVSSAMMREAQLRAELQSAEARRNETLTSLDVKLADIRSQTNAVIATKTADDGRVASMQEQVQLASQTLKEVMEEAAHASEEKNRSEAELEKTKKALEFKEAEISALRGQLAQWEEDAANLAAVRTEFQAEVESLEAKLEHSEKSKTEVAQLQQQRSRLENDLERVGEVRALEKKLQRLRESFSAVREALEQRSLEKEEAQLEVASLHDLVKARQEELEHQEEHFQLQCETSQKLQEQKIRYETEVEMLTLGLHDAVQRNDYLQDSNTWTQQQIEGLNSATLGDWDNTQLAQIESEVGKCRDEIAKWKSQAESLRRDKQAKLAMLNRQNADAMQGVQTEVQRIKADINHKEQMLRRLNAAPDKPQMPGVPTRTVMPQRLPPA